MQRAILPEHAQQAVPPPQARQACATAFRQLRDGELRRDHALITQHPLGQRVARQTETVRSERVQGQRPRLLRERPGGIHGVVVPLPLRPERRGREIIARLRQARRAVREGFGPHPDRLPDAVAVDVHSDHRPAVFVPMHRLQVHHAPQRTQALEMQEPPLPVGRVHDGPLVRPVDVGRTCLQDLPPFIGTINAL